MNKKIILSLTTSISLFVISCGTQINQQNSTSQDYSKIGGKFVQKGQVNVTIDKLGVLNNGFNLKYFNFSDERVSQLKLVIMGSGLTTPVESETKPWTMGQTVSFSLSVQTGNNRIIWIQALDNDGNIISTLGGALNVVSGDNTGNISYFDTIVAQVLSGVLGKDKQNSTSILQNVSLNNLMVYLKNLTGFDPENNSFSNFDPGKVNSLLIAENIYANNGAMPSSTLEGTNSLGNLQVELDTTGAMIWVTDLNSDQMESSANKTSLIENVTSGKWRVYAKKGEVIKSAEFVVKGGETATVNLYLLPVSITNISPSTSTGSTNITLTGSGFYPSQTGENTVSLEVSSPATETINGTIVSSNESGTELVVNFPNNTSGSDKVGKVKVTNTISGFSGMSATDFTLQKTVPDLNVFDLSPNSAKGGVEVFVDGGIFSTTSTNNIVTLIDGGGNTLYTANVTLATTGLLKVTFPLNTTGSDVTGKVKVVNTETGKSSICPEDFTLLKEVADATITTFNPFSAKGSIQVVVNGSGFNTTSGNNKVTLVDGGGATLSTATVTSASSDELNIMFPINNTNSDIVGKIKVTNTQTGKTATSTSDFTILKEVADVKVFGANVTSAKGGVEVSIDGSGFNTTSGNNTVTLVDGGGATLSTATVTSASVGLLKVTFPLNTTGTDIVGKIKVTNTETSKTATATSNFTLLIEAATLGITALKNPVDSTTTPSDVSILAGQNIEILGTAFNSPATVVYVFPDTTERAAGTITSVNSNSIVVQVPQFSGVPTTAGVKVKVTVNGNTVTSTATFRYVTFE